MASSAVLTVRNLSVSFPVPSGTRVRAVQNVDYDVAEGETVGVVGESGAGKSVALMSALGLVPPSARVEADVLEFRGQSLLGLGSQQLRRLRNQHIGVIFQDPMTSLNPTFTVGYQIGRTLRTFRRDLDRRATRARVIELLEVVGISNAARRANQYPHEFSGGMRQRAMIAMAIANSPALLVADEPTTALDVTIQAQILEVLRKAAEETGAATVLVTHDLGIVAETADRIIVMYAGQIVERAPVLDFFDSQHHFYSAALLQSLPNLANRAERLRPVAGSPISAANRPSGCAFHPRCPKGVTEAICATSEPELRPTLSSDETRSARCHFPDQVRHFDQFMGEDR